MENPNQKDFEWIRISPAINGIYQRLLISARGGTEKFIKFEKNADYPLHHHPDRHEWIYVIEGQITVNVDEKIRTLNPGEYEDFPVNSNHSLKAGDKGAVVLVSAFNTT
ncbi:cupin domain-containing protein [Oxyplasma meridianum]|uniref:Cupin domain-containing protein n=1 Tax=Oxyplasma meridianum TaxID=3073602 RepID=A0AAX4NHL8_9ARCH